MKTFAVNRVLGNLLFWKHEHHESFPVHYLLCFSFNSFDIQNPQTGLPTGRRGRVQYTLVPACKMENDGFRGKAIPSTMGTLM